MHTDRIFKPFIAAILASVLLIAIPARAGSLLARDGKSYDGRVTLDSGADAVFLRPTGNAAAQPRRFPLSDLKRVDFAAAPTGMRSGGTLSGGWKAADVGAVSVSGSTSYADGCFTLRGGCGGGLGESTEGFHLLYQQIPAEGQIIARVASLEGPRTSMCGVMIHGTLGVDPRFAAVLLTGNGIKFASRGVYPQPIKINDGVNVGAPYWIKLVKTTTAIIACESSDGHVWDQVGAIPWASPAPMVIGLVALSRDAFSPVSAVFDQVNVTIHGLRGEYFGDTQFTDLKGVRIDPRIDFNWGTSSPAKSGPDQDFSVRWTGQVEAQLSEPTAFILEADNGARLWVDGKMILDTKAAHRRDGTIPLVAGQRYDIRVDFFKGSGNGACRLGWASAHLAAETIPNSRLYFAPEDAPADAAQSIGRFRAPPFPEVEGVTLLNGSVLPGYPISSDGTTLRLLYRAQRNISVPMSQIARIAFRPVAPEAEAKRPKNATGILMSNGDFLDGEFQGLNDGKVKMNSVLFGVSSVDSGEVTAIMLPQPAPIDRATVSPRFIVRTTGGAVYMATGLRVDAGKKLILADETILGPLEIPARELASIEMPPQ